LKTQSHEPTVYLHHGNKKNIDHSWTYLFGGYSDGGSSSRHPNDDWSMHSWQMFFWYWVVLCRTVLFLY